RLPMTLRAESLPDDPSKVALLYGPIVLAADLGNAGLDQAARFGKQAPELALEEAPPAPAFAASSTEEVLSHIRPTATPLAFRSEGIAQPGDVNLVPFFRASDRRYAVYFPVLDQGARDAQKARGEAAAVARAKLDARTVDRVQPGLGPDELRHKLEQ